MVTNDEHADNTASSASPRRQPTFNLGNSPASNLIARIPASSLARNGRRENARHWKRRMACPRFSLSIPVISAHTFRPRWLAIHRGQAGYLLENNAAMCPVGRQHGGTCAMHESLQHEIFPGMSYIPSTFCDSNSITSCLSSALHLRMFASDSTTDFM